MGTPARKETLPASLNLRENAMNHLMTTPPRLVATVAPLAQPLGYAVSAAARAGACAVLCLAAVAVFSGDRTARGAHRAI